MIAGILNRQHRRTARGLSYTASRVQSLRYHWHIPCHQPDGTGQAPEGELLNVTAAARQLGIAPSTLLRWLNDGFVAGEQVTPGAPWRIRLTDQLRGMLADTAPDGWVPLGYATQALGVSRQTVLQKVKRGELRAVLTRTGHGPSGAGSGALPFGGASRGIAASFPSRNRCRPSPCAGLSPARSTMAAPPRPRPIGRQRAQPRPARWPREAGQTGTVPVFTAIRSTKEEPSSIPAASPRLPRSTSPWPPGRHPHARPGVPRPS